MSKSPCISLLVDPYHLKWKQDRADAPKSYDPRELGAGDILGNFWAVGKPILNYNSSEEVSLDYGHPFVNGHPLVRKYWDAPKEAQGSDYDKNSLATVSGKVKLCDTDAETGDAFSTHIDALTELIGEQLKDAPPEFFEIRLYCIDPELGPFIMESIKNDPKKQERLSKLRIRLVLEKTPEFLDGISQTYPAPAVLTVGSGDTDDGSGTNKFFERHLCFRLKQDDDSDKIYVTEGDEKAGNSPSFWCLKDDGELAELVWLYIDFYYLRWRYMMLWEHCLHSGLRFDSLPEAEKFIRIGISATAAAIDERECDASVMVKEKLRFIWHKVAPGLEAVDDDGIAPEVSCDGRPKIEVPTNEIAKNTEERIMDDASREQLREKQEIQDDFLARHKSEEHATEPEEDDYQDGGSPEDEKHCVEFQTGVEDLGKKLPVTLSIPGDTDKDAPPRIFVLHRDGTLSIENRYETSVSVDDDGGAAEVEIVCKGRHEIRGGKWVAPVAEEISFEYLVRAPRNGHWQPEKDPVTFTLNGEAADSPCLVPGDAGTYCAEAETKSGKTASFTLRRLPHVDAIFLNMGQLSSGGAACTIRREKNSTGLCAKGASDKQGRRVQAIRCAQGDEFVMEAYGVLNGDRAAEVWDKKCEVSLCDADGNPIDDENVCTISPDDDGKTLTLQIKRAGNFKLRISSRDVQSVVYEVDFSVFADHSTLAMAVLGGTFLLSMITTLCWYGLSILTFVIYLLCPATLYFIATHREGCMRKTWQKVLFYLIATVTVLIISKALWEELR